MNFFKNFFKKNSAQDSAQQLQNIEQDLTIKVKAPRFAIVFRGQEYQFLGEGQHHIQASQFSHILWISALDFNLDLAHHLQRHGQELDVQALYQGHVLDVQKWAFYLWQNYQENANFIPFSLEKWWQSLFEAYSSNIPLDDFKNYLTDVESFLNKHLMEYTQNLGLHLAHFSLQLKNKEEEKTAALTMEAPVENPHESHIREDEQRPCFYFYDEKGKRTGPCSIAELRNLLQEEKITLRTPVWKLGMTSWVSIESLKLFS